MDDQNSGHQGVVAQPARTDTSSSEDPHEFAEIYRRYHDRVWRTLVCLGVPASGIDDALQDVFLVVHQRRGNRDEYHSFISWIYAIARRVAWRHRRTNDRIDRKLAALEQQGSLATSGPEDAAVRGQAVDLMQQFLGSLDDDQRMVFVLCELEGLSAPQAAEVVEAKVPTVYSRLRLARRRFEAMTARLELRSQREEAR